MKKSSDGKAGHSTIRTAGRALAALLRGHKRRGRYTGTQVRELLDQRFPGQAVSFRERPGKQWICWFDDLPDVVFLVKVGKGGGDPLPMTYPCLRCDAGEVIWRYYVEQYCKEWGSLDAWSITKPVSGETYFQLSYTSMEEVRRAAAQLDAFYQWGRGRLHWDCVGRQRACIFCTFQGGPLPAVNASGSQYFMSPNRDCDGLLKKSAELIREYYACYLLPCKDFTQEELLSYAEEKWNWGRKWCGPECIWRGEEGLPPEMFSGVCPMSRKWLKVTFGGLYLMAVRLGLAVEGDPERFTLRGANGSTYQFSYRFCRKVEVTRYNRQKVVVTVWHYLRDGERVEPEAWTYARSGTPVPAVKLGPRDAEALLGIRPVFPSVT